MNKKTKTGLVVGGLLLLGAGALWLIKRVNSTCKELEEREKQNQKLFEEAGISTEEVDENDVSEDEDGTVVDIAVNLPKQLNELISRDNKYDIEAVDINTIFSDKGEVSEKVVHIMQRYDRRIKRNVLDILFEIPLSALWSGPDASRKRLVEDGYTCTGDFVSSIRGKWNRDKEVLEGGILDEIRYYIGDFNFMNGNATIKRTMNDPIVGSVVDAYMQISYKEHDGEDWKAMSTMMRVDQRLLQNNPFGDEEIQPTEFVCKVREELEKRGGGIPLDVNTYIKNPEQFKDLEILDAIAVVRITIAIQDNQHLDGINANSLKQLADSIYNRFEVEGMRGGIFRYEHFLCYVPDTLGDIKAYGINGKEYDL